VLSWQQEHGLKGTFRGIEGLRGWLAWTVVASHIFQGMAVWRYVRAGPVIAAGNDAVFTFIVISGFVITHLIVTRPEPYPAYIGRRFLRLFPVYLVCLAIGVITTIGFDQAILAQPWGAQSPPLDEFNRQIISLHAHPYAHLLAHLTMLHGLIPDQVLDNASLIFLSPAWSLSLEWQFYLVAPLIIAAAQRPRGALLLTTVFLPAYALYWTGHLGTYGAPWGHPSVLFGAAPLFALGIATRLAVTMLPALHRYPLAPVLWLVGCIALVDRDAVFAGIWLAMVPYMLLHQPADRVSQAIDRTLHALLDSRIALWLGQRSYTTYLIHFPVVQAIIWACARGGLAYWPSVAVLAAGTVLLTLIASDVIHRLVEQPGIALGKRMWRSSGRQTGPAVRVG
jgi:peptidoglycan/LPS O-acetylase OafA/YrhL